MAIRNHGAWWQTSIFYQVYPRSFYDSNNDGVGDLQGIRQKLDYLQWLGIDAIWLSPICKSPMADFGYDVSDYTCVDPIFGTMEDFDALLEDIHQRGMKLVLDFVPNHTSSEHPWFQESRSSRTNAKSDWYIWRDPTPEGKRPNNWESFIGDSAWDYDEQRGQYYLHIFYDKQPDLNWRNPEVRAALYDVMRYWLDRGVDGLRIDAIWMLLKDPQLHDDPPNPAWQEGGFPGDQQLRSHMEDQPGIHDIAREMRAVADAYQDRVLIGEIHLPLDRFIRYYGGAALDEIHLPFNFALITAQWKAPEVRQIVDQYEAALPRGAWPDWALGCHDYVRVRNRIGREQERVAHMLLLTLRGTPICYYGDEIEMCDGEVPPQKVRDPEAIAAPRFDRGAYRTPMQWNSEPNAGFSRQTPWLAAVKDSDGDDVAAQCDHPASHLTMIRRLIQIRSNHPALRSGTYQAVDTSCTDVFAYLRETDEQRVLVVLNFVGTQQHLDLSQVSQYARVLCSTTMQRDGEIALNQVALEPNEGLMLLV
ncbi:MAG TPA: alpha-amylase family glycosyl hydrolase [Ktedonobacteraceae bacterium]|nr:alpha-amylase family glycosyl hydrolase [Ktedonobacteraceae bacterium]